MSQFESARLQTGNDEPMARQGIVNDRQFDIHLAHMRARAVHVLPDGVIGVRGPLLD